MRSIERKAAAILCGIAAAEGIWVGVNWSVAHDRFWRWMGFHDLPRAGAVGWALALLISAAYIGYASNLPSVRANLFRPSLLKVFAIFVAINAGMCEEGIFRKVLMNALAAHGWSIVLQVIASALAFGAVHAIWGIMKGSWRAALGAMIATGVLGGSLAALFIASHRILAPCVAAHFLINLSIEPGLVLAALSGEMGKRLRPATTPAISGR